MGDSDPLRDIENKESQTRQEPRRHSGDSGTLESGFVPVDETKKKHYHSGNKLFYELGRHCANSGVGEPSIDPGATESQTSDFFRGYNDAKDKITAEEIKKYKADADKEWRNKVTTIAIRTGIIGLCVLGGVMFFSWRSEVNRRRLPGR